MTERLRYLVDNAAGTAFLPPAWQELADALPLLLDVVDATRVVKRTSWYADALGRRDAAAIELWNTTVALDEADLDSEPLP